MTAEGQGHLSLLGRGASLPPHHSDQVEIDIHSASGPIYTPYSPLMRPRGKATARTEEEEQLRRLAVEVQTRDNFYRGRPIKVLNAAAAPAETEPDHCVEPQPHAQPAPQLHAQTPEAFAVVGWTPPHLVGISGATEVVAPVAQRGLTPAEVEAAAAATAVVVRAAEARTIAAKEAAERVAAERVAAMAAVTAAEAKTVAAREAAAAAAAATAAVMAEAEVDLKLAIAEAEAKAQAELEARAEAKLLAEAEARVEAEARAEALRIGALSKEDALKMSRLHQGGGAASRRVGAATDEGRRDGAAAEAAPRVIGGKVGGRAKPKPGLMAIGSHVQVQGIEAELNEARVAWEGPVASIPPLPDGRYRPLIPQGAPGSQDRMEAEAALEAAAAAAEAAVAAAEEAAEAEAEASTPRWMQ